MMRFSTLSAWLEWLEDPANTPKKIKLSIEHLLPIAQQLNIIDFDIPVVLVAGTNGKGTTIALLESIYQAAGYRTAIYTSPHLIHFTERLRINSRELSEKFWCEAFAVVDAARKDLVLSYFEFTTLAGLWIMRQQQAELDVLLLEIGMGGRLDAMNIVNPDVAVITTIEFDHMEYLGDTREKIAYEKAGIMRANRPAVCGDYDPPASLFVVAEQLQAPFACQSKDFSFQQQNFTWEWHNAQHRLTGLPLPVLPLQNASLVLQVIDELQTRLPVNRIAIDQGLANARLVGRMQTINEAPEVIIDVAHNPHAASYLAQHLPRFRRNQGRLVAVVGMKADKDIAQTLALMKPLVDVWYVATVTQFGGATAEQLLAHLKECHSHGFNDVKTAYLQALTDARDNDTIIVFGSFFTVGPVLEVSNERRYIAATATTA